MSTNRVPKRRRQLAYWLVGIGLTVALLPGHFSNWIGSSQLHTIMEVIATLLAIMVGLMALVRFYVKKESVFLFVGSGFLGTAFLDGFHAVVTSAYFKPMMPSDLPSLIPWSWVASRTFLSVFMVLSWLAWKREASNPEGPPINEYTVYMGTAVFTLLSFWFFAFVPLPRAYYSEIFFHRPEEFPAALLFLVALIGYLRKGVWQNDYFEHWLVLSLILGFVGQAVFMSHSGMIFDYEFDVAHTIKKVSYIFVMIGLLISMFLLFKRGEQTRAELQITETRTQSIVDSMVDALITIDDKGIIESFNHAAQQMFGYKADEVIGQNIKILMPEPYTSEHDGYLNHYIDTGKSKIIGVGREVMGLRRNHSTFPMDLAISEIRLGNKRFFSGTVRDVSVRKIIEKHLEKQSAELKRTNQDLERFVYVASHDLKAPMRGIDNLATWIEEDLEGKLEDDTRENLVLLRNRVNRMENLLDGLLDYSRVGHEATEPESVDTRKLITNIVDFLSLPNGFSVDMPDSMPVLTTEKVSLEQVFRNLINNAVKHHDRDKGRITVIGSGSEGTYEFSVSDDGTGIAPEFHERVFTMFQTLKPRDEVEGSGMGLALVKKEVELHGGTVQIHSEADSRGTTFHFTWK